MQYFQQVESSVPYSFAKPKTPEGFSVEICGRTFKHTYSTFCNTFEISNQPSLPELTLEEYVKFIPRIYAACEATDLDCLTCTPYWGVAQLLATRYGLTRLALPKPFLVEDAFIAFVVTREDDHRYGFTDTNLSYIQPLTADTRKIARALGKYGEQIAPICDIPANLVRGHESLLQPLVASYIEREVFLPTLALATLPGGRLSRKRSGIKRYEKDHRYRLDNIDSQAYEPKFGDDLMRAWLAQKPDGEPIASKAEYLTILRMPQLFREYGIDYTSSLVWDQDRSLLAGAAFSVPCSTRRWTNILRFARKYEYQYLSDYLWVSEARKWQVTGHSESSDGNTNEWLDENLFKFKARYVQACQGKMRDLYYLTTGSDAEHLRICATIRRELDSHYDANVDPAE